MQNTHIGKSVRAIHGALLDIISVMNRPWPDEILLSEAGVKLDRALFPLLVGIERFGPIGIVDLAECIGRDYTTVSRQVGKLETLGLVERRAAKEDKRVREAMVTANGKAMTDRIDAARERIARTTFQDWEPEELEEFARLMRKFANCITTRSASDDG